MSKLTVRGVATINFYANDHAGAKQWYSELFGMEPYFDIPGYFEFRLGDHQQELGVIDGKYAPGGIPDQPSGAVVHWHVDDLEGALAQLLVHGATLYQPIIDHSVGEGGTFITASVVDPFGNIFGIMTNTHYLDMLMQRSGQ